MLKRKYKIKTGKNWKDNVESYIDWLEDIIKKTASKKKIKYNIGGVK